VDNPRITTHDLSRLGLVARKLPALLLDADGFAG